MTHPSMNDELNSRLDELFDDGSSLEEKPKETSPLECLKAAILEMEWEIGDTTLSKFLNEVCALKKPFQHDKAFSVYIKLLETVGRYLKSQKAGSHPETVSFLQSLFDDLERISGPEVSVAERNRSAVAQATAFKQFKALIAPATAAKVSQASQVPGNGISDEMRVYIRQVVREEIVRLVKRK